MTCIDYYGHFPPSLAEKFVKPNICCNDHKKY